MSYGLVNGKLEVLWDWDDVIDWELWKLVVDLNNRRGDERE